MSLLATALPITKRLILPLSRDQIMLLMVAVNQVFLGLDTYLSHVLSGTIRPSEWPPIIFGPVAGVVLLIAGLLARKQRLLASGIASITLLLSIIVGVVGAYFHVVRAALPSAGIGQQLTLDLLVWGPPVLGPLYFVMAAALGLLAIWREDPVDSGKLTVTRAWSIQLPYSKTQAYFFTIAMGILAALISSTLDHARNPFSNPWFYLPVAVAVFALVETVMLGIINKPSRNDLFTHLIAMLALITVGLIGLGLHIGSDLVFQGEIVLERFLKGAPFLAPLLFANMGALGLIVLLDPNEH